MGTGPGDPHWEDNLVRKIDNRVTNRVYSMLLGFVKQHVAETVAGHTDDELIQRLDRCEAELFEQRHRLEELRVASGDAVGLHEEIQDGIAKTADGVSRAITGIKAQLADQISAVQADIFGVREEFEAVHGQLGRGEQTRKFPSAALCFARLCPFWHTIYKKGNGVVQTSSGGASTSTSSSMPESRPRFSGWTWSSGHSPNTRRAWISTGWRPAGRCRTGGSLSSGSRRRWTGGGRCSVKLCRSS